MNKNAFSERFDQEWIKRVNEWASPIAESINAPRLKKINDYNKTEASKISKEKYLKTEKARITIKKRNGTRHKRFREQSDKLGKIDKELIKDFYVKCPLGHEVDHIIPLSKGGKHHINNLQYLTRQENRRKSNKILDERGQIIYEYHKDPELIIASRDCQFCLNEMRYLSDETLYCDICRKAFSTTYQT